MAASLINGVNYSWSNIIFVLFGIPVAGITKISYGAKQNKPNNYGTGVDPVSRGYENRVYEASIEIYEDEWRKIIAASPFLSPLDVPPFSIQVVFGGSRVLAKTDILNLCEFTDDSFSSSQGEGKIMRTIPLAIGGITHL